MAGFLDPEYRLARVQPSGQPLEAPQVQVNPAMFGATEGVQLQQAGARTELASDQTFKAALYQQGLQNEADAKAADAAATTEMRTVLFDPQNGYYAKRGKDAIDGAPAVLQQLDGIKQKYTEGLKSPEAAKLFGDTFTRRIESAQDQISRKVLVERQTYADTASDARVKGFIADAENNYPDQKAIDQNLAGIQGELVSQAEITKESPDVTLMKIRTAQSKALTGVIQRMVEADPYRAQQLRQQYAGQISGADNIVVDKVVKEGLLRRGSQDRADAIRAGNSGEGTLDNNIGNITKSSFSYAGGKGAPQGNFETFTTPEHGVAAAYQTVQAKAKQNGGAISFNDLIGGNAKVKGWAPADDGSGDPLLKGNDPKAYAARLAQSVGLKPTDNVPIDDNGKMATMLAEMNRHEKGRQTVPNSAFPGGIALAQGQGRDDNLKAATADLDLTPQEQALYQRHLTNLYGPGGVTNADGSRSSLYQITTMIDGKAYTLPTVYDGKILTPDQAVEKAKAIGLDKFPSYATEQEAEDRYQKIHAYMDKDTATYMQQNGGAGPVIDQRTGQPTLDWQVAQAQKIADPELRAATLQRVRSLHAQDDAALAERRRMTGQEVQGLIMQGNLTDVSQIPADKWISLEPDQQRAFRAQLDANVRGKDNPPNPALYAELSRQMADDPSAFVKRDLVPLASQLPKEDWKHFQNLQASVSRKDAAAAEKQITVSHAMQVSDALLKSAGIYLGFIDNKGKMLNDKGYKDFVASYQAQLLKEVDQFQNDNKRRPTDDDLNKMADRLLLQGRFRGTGIFSEDRAVAFQRQVGEGSPQFHLRYGDIPADRRQAMESQLKARGLPADKTSVENAYTAWRMAGNR